MSRKIFDNDLVEIHKSKVTLKLNKLGYVGMYLLDLSKVLMHEFRYDHIKNNYGNKSRLLFFDTDCLIYEIKAEDVDEDFNNYKQMFDSSNFSSKSK